MHFQMGEIQFCPDSRQVIRGGREVHCEPLTFDLIHYLILHRKRVLSRRELLDALWPGKVVTDGSLSNEIKEARKVLADSATAQQFIRTVPKCGYQFVHGVIRKGRNAQINPS